MLILGDFASFKSKLDINGIDDQKTLLINCEGYLSEKINNQNSFVFNNVELYRDIGKKFNLILNLSNNHTSDIPAGVSQTLELSEKYNLKTVGAGRNLEEACKPFIFLEKGVDVAIISAGWEIIGCIPATTKSEGVAPLESKKLIQQVLQQKKLNRKVIVYLHWDYELEVYPQPSHRDLAKNLIDHGADIVLGCHSHCMQGFEVYKDKYIFYGLGNSVFDENYYFNGKLKFPDFCKTGLAVDWDPLTNSVSVANTEYSEDRLHLNAFTLPEKNIQLVELSQFSSLSSADYINFFKKNRRKKNFLPIFTEDDNTISYKIKRFYLLVRASLIKQMFVLGLKGHSK